MQMFFVHIQLVGNNINATSSTLKCANLADLLTPAHSPSTHAIIIIIIFF